MTGRVVHEWVYTTSQFQVEQLLMIQLSHSSLILAKIYKVPSTINRLNASLEVHTHRSTGFCSSTLGTEHGVKLRWHHDSSLLCLVVTVVNKVEQILFEILRRQKTAPFQPASSCPCRVPEVLDTKTEKKQH